MKNQYDKFWQYIGDPPTALHCPRISHVYYVPLSDMRNSAEVLDWIVQISHKTWATSEIVGDFVKKLDALLDLQANYCSGGVEQRDGRR